MSRAYDILYGCVCGVLGLLLFPCLLRTIRGPRIADRVLGINMIGTVVVMLIAVLTVMLGEGYLIDIAVIYALLSFLAVVVLSKIYIGIYRARHEEAKK